MTTAPWKIVTPDQFRRGWEYMDGMTVVHRDYVMLGRNANGDYIVRNPLLQLQEERLPMEPRRE